MTFGNMLPRHWRREVEDFPLAPLQKSMNKLFDNFFSDDWALPVAWQTDSSGFVPRINVTEDEKKILVTCELPGMDEKDFEVTLNKDALIIKGEKRVEHEKNEAGTAYFERSYGSFQRVVPLRTKVDEDKIEANFKNGVLHLTLPKTIESQKESRKISVKRA